MSFHRYLSRLRQYVQGNRSAQRVKERRRPRFKFHRPSLEHLEDRIVLDAASNLAALHNASGTVANFASSLASGPLNQDLPIISGSAGTLGQILGVSSTFDTIKNALNNIDPTKVNNAANKVAELQKELNSGGSNFSVLQLDDNQVVVKYTQSITAAPVLSAATDVTDFFGNNQAANYFSKIASLSGSANGQFAAGTAFTITFGADSNGFFVNPGAIFTSPDFKATLNLNGTVNVGQSVFSAAMNGTGTIDLQNINLGITQRVSGSNLSNIGQSASFSIGSGSLASVTGDFKASVLGVPLVDWGTTISWAFAGNGAAQSPQISVPRAPSFLDNAVSSVETAMLNSLTDALGLSQFNVLLDPLSQVPGGMQDIISFITSLTQSNVNSTSLNPSDGLSQLLSESKKPQNSSFFTLASPTDLLDFAQGKPGATLITFATPDPINFLHVPLDFSIPGIPVASFLGLVNLTLGGKLDLTFDGSASFSLGLDSSGLFVNTDPAKTNITFAAQAGAGVVVAANVVGIIEPGSMTIGPNFETKLILELQPEPASKLYLSTLASNIDQSGALSGLGNWLKKSLQLEVDLNGNIKLDLQVNTPVGGLIEGLPGPAGDVLKPFAGGYQVFIDFLGGATEEICNVVNSVVSWVPFVGKTVSDVLDCKIVKKVTEIYFGQYLDILDPFFESLGAKSVHSNGGQTADYIWTFPIFNAKRIFKDDQISNGNNPASTPNKSDPSDFIQYEVNGSTLTIIGAAGADNIRIQDLGNGQIQLLRSGIDDQGRSRTDPSRVFSGITQIDATMNSSSGMDSSFIMDASLAIDTLVNGGAGNERIITGAGNDTIYGGGGNDYLESSGGTNHIYAGDGKSTLVGGSGTDYLYGGSADNLFRGGSGTEYMMGGSGNDIFVAGSGIDVIYGGSGSNTFRGGSGTATFYGGNSGPNSTNNYFGGSGTVTAYGGQGANIYSAASGTMDVHGGPGQDMVHWQAGDGNLTFDGGSTRSPSAPDKLLLTGSKGPDTFVASANGNIVSIAAAGATISASNIQVLNIDGGRGADTITVYDLSGTTLQAIGLNSGKIGNPDGSLDTIALYGPSATTVDIGETTGTAYLVQPPQPGQVIQFTPFIGPVMHITGLGPTVVVPNDEDAVTVHLGGSNTVNVNTQSMHGSLMVNGGAGVNQFNVQAVSGPTTINTTGGRNTINVGSQSPNVGGALSGITAALILNGSGGSDTANVDDSGDSTPRTGTLTPTTLTGLGMGPSGITYSGLAALNIALGSGGNSFTIRDINPATVTSVQGGASNNDRLLATFAQDMNGKLLLTQFEQSTIQVARDLNGYLSDTAPGSVQLLSIGRSLTATGQVVVGSLDTLTIGQDLAGSLLDFGDLGSASIGNDLSGSMTVDGNATTIAIGGSLTNTGIVNVSNSGNPDSANLVRMTIGPDQLSPGHDMAGQIIVSGTLTLLRVAGGTPGAIVAGHVGSVLVYGGYGPLVSQIKENGIQRRIEAALPGDPYPLPDPPPAQTPPNNLPGVLFQYTYESGSLGLANPQLTARVTNRASTAPDQYDLSLVVFSDTAKFNLARLDAAGVSGIRNIAVEGDLLTSVSTAAVNFTGGDTAPAGVQLPKDALAAVAVRDYAPQGSIRAASIQAAAFGSTRDGHGNLITGPNARANDAENLLASGTTIVQANDTFRVPFAKALPVAFFMDTQAHNHHFDSQGVLFTDQAANDARGAVTALIGVTVPVNRGGQPGAATIQSIALRGDGGAIQTQQAIAQSITSTGPLGDLILTAAGGLGADVTAPSIFGNIKVKGPIAGTIQTTGLRTDPITGLISTIAADWGQVTAGQVPSTTVVQAQGGGITGRLISRGDFFSQITADGGISGLLAVQGNLGIQVGGEDYGGILSNGTISGQVVVLGDVLGDIVAHGGLKGGRIAVQGDIRGNTVLDGGIDAGSALVSGGSIGNAAAGTGLIAGNVKGILAAKGAINLLGQTNTSKAAYFKANLDSVDPPSAAAIDTLFSNGGVPLDFDLSGLDLAGLTVILQRLKALSVKNGTLV